MGTIWVALGTFVLGLVLGALGGVFYLRKKMQNMQLSDQDIASMAKSMGMNLNQKQLAQVTKRMKNANVGQQKKRK